MSGTVHVERVGRHILTAELDNPPRNTLQAGMVARLHEAVLEAEADGETRVLVITGRGPAFCAGANLRDEHAATEGRAPAEFQTGIRGLFQSLDATRLPVVGLINGWCVGGGLELALYLDIRIASLQAKFVCAGVNVGLIASAYRLPRLVGVAAAKAMLLTGSPFDAEAALRFNLVTEVHPPEALRAAGLALAERIASRAPLSVEASKRIADMALDLPREEGDRALGREAKVLAQSEDHKAALAAFLAKTEPVFTRK
jgi:enoyl-CoA hydratase/carnithine racemase